MKDHNKTSRTRYNLAQMLETLHAQYPETTGQFRDVLAHDEIKDVFAKKKRRKRQE